LELGTWNYKKLSFAQNVERKIPMTESFAVRAALISVL
jgi:hypothetical protein